MELKKSKNADLENKKNTFLLFGLVIALGLVLVAFEWKTNSFSDFSLGEIQSQEVEEEIIPITRQEEIKPPPPPPPKIIEVLNIVDNDSEIDEELEIEDSEADDETIVDIAPIIMTTDEEDEEEETVFLIVEEQPEFPGGIKALYSYINKTVSYPVIAQENGIQGKIFLRFVVNVDGSVADATVTRGVDMMLDKEALRVVNSLPKFKPGKQRGRPVRVFFNASINFQLQ
jgi:protein TonB